MTGHERRCQQDRCTCEISYEFRRRLAMVLCSCVLSLIFCDLAAERVIAQSEVETPTSEWEARGLGDKTVEIAAIGLELHLPLDSSYVFKPQSERRLEIVAKDKSWIAAVDVRMTENDEVTVATVADETIRDSSRNSTFTETPRRATLDISGQKAERLELRMRPAAGQDDVHAMYTIFKPQPKTFVVYKVWTKSTDYEAIFKIHRSVVESFRFSDPQEMAEARISETQRTTTAFDRMTPEAYREMLEPVRWYRVYTNDEEGNEQEVAYYLVRETAGMVGMINPGAVEERLTGSERDEGVLAELRSRFLLSPDGTDYVDVESRSWMSLDRKSERWLIRTGRYQSNSPGGRHILVTRSTITGHRDGDRIQVLVDVPPVEPETVILRKPKESYVCQAEQHLLYRILKPWEAKRYGMYMYEPQLQKLVYRTEEFTLSDPVTVVSKRFKDAQPNQVMLDQNGLILRIELANGHITVPSTLDDLMRMWKAKGLPTGRSDG